MEELLQCAICLKRVVDPRYLPCHHSFCLGCLEDLQTHRENHLRCPSCNKQVHFTTPNQLPPDLRANSLSLFRASTFTEASYQRALQNAVNELQVCGLCREQLRDPRILPCHHSFCMLCVQSRQGASSFSCPTCGSQLHTNATNLPADFWINSLSTLRKTSQPLTNYPTHERGKVVWISLFIGMAALMGLLLWTKLSATTVYMAEPKQFKQSTNLRMNTEIEAALSSILHTCLYHMVKSEPDVDKDNLVTVIRATFHQDFLSGRFLETTPGLASLALTYVHRMTHSKHMTAESQKTLGAISLTCLEHWRECKHDVENTRALASMSEMCITDVMNQQDTDGVVLALRGISLSCIYPWTKSETSSDSLSALTSVTHTCLLHWIRLAGNVESGTTLPSITQISMTLLKRTLPSTPDAGALYAMSGACIDHIIRTEPHRGHQILWSVSNTCIDYLGQPGKEYIWKETIVSILQSCVQYSGGTYKNIRIGNVISTCMSHMNKYPSETAKTMGSIATLGVNALCSLSRDAEVETVLYNILQVCLDVWTNYGSSSLPSDSQSMDMAHGIHLHPIPTSELLGYEEVKEAPSEASGVFLLAFLLILVLKLNLDDSVTKKESTVYYSAVIIGALAWGEVILKRATSKSLLDALGGAVVKCTIPFLCPAIILILVFKVFIWIEMKQEKGKIGIKDNPSFTDVIKTLFMTVWLCFVFSIFQSILDQLILFVIASYVFVICIWSLWYLPTLITIFAMLLGGGISVGAVMLSVRLGIPLKLTCNALLFAIFGTIAIPQ